jgi:hypothetical protein
MSQGPHRSAQEIFEAMTDEQRRMAAEALATMHRFSPEPTFKYGKPVYQHANTVEAISRAKAKRGK